MKNDTIVELLIDLNAALAGFVVGHPLPAYTVAEYQRRADRMIERLDAMPAAESSACRKEAWCVRQVGHPGECMNTLPRYMADGSVIP